jgi:preprotein translocase subunit SecA
MNVIANLKKSYESLGKEVALSIDKGVTLATIDDSWKEHLREMDDLKQSVQAATYEQKDPLLIYKFESFQLFKNMLEKINRESISFIIKGNLPIREAGQVREAQIRGRGNLRNLKEERTDLLSQAHADTQHPQKAMPVKVEKKVGRNDPCPCGSGKKYKHCHGR